MHCNVDQKIFVVEVFKIFCIKNILSLDGSAIYRIYIFNFLVGSLIFVTPAPWRNGKNFPIRCIWKNLEARL